MSSLDIPDPAQIEFIPYFQPILKLDNRRIYGYEALGRMRDPSNGSIKSAGPLFHKLGQSPEHRPILQDIDSRIQEAALGRVCQGNHALFMNIMPHTLTMAVNGKSTIAGILERVRDCKIDPSRVVLEITEDEFTGELEHLVAIVDDFKREGLQIAVDDAGAGDSDLNRIALIRPDIIKVDLNLLRQSIQHVAFRQVLQTVAALSHRLGSSLLFEGVEREEELFMALRMGARYLQGFLFSEARADLQDRQAYSETLEKFIREHSTFAVAELIQSFQIRDDLIYSIRKAAEKLDLEPASVTHSLETNLSNFPDHVHRIAVYDSEGTQLSSEFSKAPGRWSRDDATVGHIVSWRPYFLHAIALKRYQEQDWYITEPHYDMKAQFPRIVVCLVLGEDRVLVAEADWMG